MVPSASPPDHWPEGIEYLRSHSVPSPLLPAMLASRYCNTVTDVGSPFSPSAYSRIRLGIRRIDERTPFTPRSYAAKSASTTTARHPALGQYGLFALQDIPPNTFIRPYFGRVHSEDETDPNSEYDMKVEHVEPSLQHGVSGSIAIDATQCGNEARFVNDYRSIMPHPNCELDNWSVHSGSDHELRGMGVFSGSKTIRAGTELTVNYGKGFWSRYARDESGDEAEVAAIGGQEDRSEAALQPTTPATAVQALLARQRNRLARPKGSIQ
ncbi:hypothetical protein ACQY0O_005985 [Thecaphora frezii]